jgi:hypothetical protein
MQNPGALVAVSHGSLISFVGFTCNETLQNDSTTPVADEHQLACRCCKTGFLITVQLDLHGIFTLLDNPSKGYNAKCSKTQGSCDSVTGGVQETYNKPRREITCRQRDLTTRRRDTMQSVVKLKGNVIPSQVEYRKRITSHVMKSHADNAMWHQSRSIMLHLQLKPWSIW